MSRRKKRCGGFSGSTYKKTAEKQAFQQSVPALRNTKRPKVPGRKFSPSQSIKTEVHALGFYGFYKIAPHQLGSPFGRAVPQGLRGRTQKTKAA